MPGGAGGGKLATHCREHVPGAWENLTWSLDIKPSLAPAVPSPPHCSVLSTPHTFAPHPSGTTQKQVAGSERESIWEETYALSTLPLQWADIPGANEASVAPRKTSPPGFFATHRGTGRTVQVVPVQVGGWGMGAAGQPVAHMPSRGPPGSASTRKGAVF